MAAKSRKMHKIKCRKPIVDSFNLIPFTFYLCPFSFDHYPTGRYLVIGKDVFDIDLSLTHSAYHPGQSLQRQQVSL